MGIVAKYKFDGSVYADLIPEFNAEFTDYTITDEVEGNIITRTIESDSLPTLMRFGQVYVDGEIVNNQSKSLLQVLDMNISKLTTFNSMFRHCNNLVGVTCVWDDIHPSATNMNNMFQYCYNLSELDMSNCNVSKVNLMFAMFNHCYKLHNLDLSRWDMRNVSNMSMMFHNCQNLSRLDISNLDTSNKLTDTMLNNTLILTDIGMIYCDQSTINKVASLLPTDHNITIWVESDDILQYDQYDHITYKTQKVQDTVHLNSPLLMGDTIEVIDGKTYHVHRYKKAVFDGSEDEGWLIQTVNNYFCTPEYSGWHSLQGYSNYGNYTKFQNIDGGGYGVNYTYCYRVRLEEMNPEVMSLEDFKYKLSQQPLIVIHNLATPYYELISEDPLELTLLDTIDNTINNNSILPSNMTIANKELSTIAIKPDTTYTLSFDKSIEDSEVTIDICGGEQITTVLNRIELTTPSELGSGIRFISSDGCIISNVRLLEGSLVESAIPKETFEGLKNSFEDNVVTQEMVDSGEESEENLGKYKVEYKVTGKNKCSSQTNFKGYYSAPWTNGNHLQWVNSDTARTTDYIHVRPDTTYTVRGNGVNRCGIQFFRDAKGTPPYNGLTIDTRVTSILSFTTDSLCNYIRVQLGGEVSYEITDIQLEEGSTPTEYEPYKEDIKTYYLSSPLLEGDTIEDVSGVATHVKRYGKVVLDGSEQWEMFADIGKFYSRCIDNYAKDTSISISDKFADRLSIGDTIKIGGGLAKLGIHKLDKTTVSDFKQWLSQNPTTVVYELASPTYEPISTESILCDSYVNGHLDFDSAVPIQKVMFKGFGKSLVYSQPSTKYILQFNSDNVGIIDYVDISGTAQTDVKEVTKGINKFNIKTPSDSEYSWLAIYGIGFNASNIQVVEANEDIDFDYFKGLQSSFESELVTDENDENYGKYKVECRIVGKNKFDGYMEIGNLDSSSGNNVGNISYKRSDFIRVLPNTDYTIYVNDTYRAISIYLYDNNFQFIKHYYGSTSYTTPSNCSYLRFRLGVNEDISLVQLEEGTQATSYEPYKESIHTLYLNSPLLKGDKLVVHEGKLCHYHKMGMVVLDGSENWEISYLGLDNTLRFACSDIDNMLLLDGNNIFYKSDKFASYTSNYSYGNDFESISGKDGLIYLRISKSRLSRFDADGIKQWLQQNPTTVVYELEEPYYEPIEPQISQYSFSTVKDGDMEIITALPIEIDLTYRTDINGVSSIEEQIASIQESTDISSIIDEEVDE